MKTEHLSLDKLYKIAEALNNKFPDGQESVAVKAVYTKS